MKLFDQSAWFGSACRAAVVVGLGLTLGLVPRAVRAQCTGDCNMDGKVTVDDLLTMISVDLGELPFSDCTMGDANGDNKIDISEILKAINIATNPGGACPSTGGICGDGHTDSGEDCDDGGTCLGGSNAGTHCTAESQCTGDGVCQGGPNASRPCTGDNECAGTTCRKCVPQGGDGCAANCTSETDITFNLKPGVVNDDGISVKDGTSGAIVHGDVLTIPLPLTGTQTLTVGKARNSAVPVIVKAASVHFPQIDVGGLACACVRGVAAKTCGGTAFTKQGAVAQNCTPGYSNNGDTAHDGPCPAELPCAFIHGPGNAATGELGCTGATGIDILFTQDDADGSCNPGPCTGKPSITLSGSGGPGSGLLLNSTAIGNVVGACTAGFCTDSDPFSARGSINTLPITTGKAQGTFTNANGIADDTICQCSTGDPSCLPNQCTQPWTANGSPITCDALAAGNIIGSALAGSFTSPNVPIVGDAVITNVLVAGPNP